MRFRNNNNVQAVAVAAILGTVLLTGCGTKEASANGAPPPSSEAKPTGLGSLFSSTHPVTVPQGTVLNIRTMTTLSTRNTKTGETVRATLDAPLVVSGVVLAPRGTDVTLLVADSNPGGRVKGRAQIGLRLTSIQLAGETTPTPLATSVAWHQARGTKGKDAAKIGVMAGVGAAIGALAGGGKGAAIGAGAGGGAGTAVVLSTHGDPAVVPAESVLQFRLEQPLTVNVKS